MNKENDADACKKSTDAEHVASANNGAAFHQVTLNPKDTIAALIGSDAAYIDYLNDNSKKLKSLIPVPPGFKLIRRFTGWDRFLSAFGAEERFVLVFQSKADPKTLLIAFRGTSSNLDIYEDLWANSVAFNPAQAKAPFPANVLVASGFNSVYTDKGPSMKQSMQEQLFTFLKSYGPLQKVYITGHSLGAALATLFTLDMAASFPAVKTSTTTFASPRVGLKEFATVYTKKFDLDSTTFRVYNYWDYIPSLPPELLGYQHIGQPFQIDFKRKGAWFPHIMARHSLDNYTVVLTNALHTPDQVWVGDFPDKTTPGYAMESLAPSHHPSSEQNAPTWYAL